ncbi:MAG: polymerase, sigma-24 subunit, subfamily [Bryobacterales bacterium]|nr:polymerase, sigma-24 subunit, subfamily [Bryobacterales bacterium]
MESERSVSTAQSSEQPDNLVYDWSGMVDRIQRNDETAMEELYRVFSRGIRFYLCRQLGPQDLDDRVHDCFLIVVQAIRKGDLREPERLMGFVRTIVRRQIAGHIETAVQTRRQQVDIETSGAIPDRRLDPETFVIGRQEEELAAAVLKGISRRDREILTRFYLHEQSQEQICREMRLTETQFRLLKSRAKARFGELGKRKLFRKVS